MTKVLLLGTGYLGGICTLLLLYSPGFQVIKDQPNVLTGTILNRLLANRPTLSIAALVRSRDKANLITTAHPSVRTIIADLDSSDTIISESSAADIIITAANGDHPGHIKSIYDGMAKNTSGKPIYLIHSSGTGVLIDTSLAKAGESAQSKISDKVWDDIDDIEGIYNLPAEQLHRNVDLVVQAPPLDKNPNIRYAIVCPPFIYGEGSGPVNRRNTLCPTLFEAFVKNGKGFTLGKGENSCGNVHVEDLADLYVLLVEEALKECGGRATWGRDGGWYFAENGRHKWGDVAREITKIACERGYLGSEMEELGVEQVQRLDAFGPYLWGTNSLSKSSRARKELGWAPRREGMEETLSDEVETVAKKLGNLKSV
ncbi:hypothetical protein TWF281_001481 [Arthrobotrys megalospora]